MRQRPSCPSSMCLSSFFVLVHQFLWNSGSRTHGPGKVLKLAQLQVFYSHAVMLHHFCGFGMLLTSSTSGPLQAESETLLPSWLRCLHMVDKKAIILRCCMLQCCLCLLIMSLPIQLQDKNTSQLVSSASHILQQWNSAKSPTTGLFLKAINR